MFPNHSLSRDKNQDKNKKRRPFQRNPFRSTRGHKFRRPRFRDSKINLIQLLPNLLTCLNISCGVGAILFAVNNQYEIAATLILLAAFFDLIDGKVARLIGADSAFGVQLDSLADQVSFGIAPPVLIHSLIFDDLNRLGVSIVLIYSLCSALRLARYNIQAMASKKKRQSFVGLPCPVPGCFLAALVLASREYGLPIQHPVSLVFLHITMVCLSGLMVSTIPYPDLASRKLDKRNVYHYNVLIVLVLCVAILRFKAVLLILTGLFILTGPIYAIRAHVQKRKSQDSNAPDEVPSPTPGTTTQE